MHFDTCEFVKFIFIDHVSIPIHVPVKVVNIMSIEGEATTGGTPLFNCEPQSFKNILVKNQHATPAQKLYHWPYIRADVFGYYE